MGAILEALQEKGEVSLESESRRNRDQGPRDLNKWGLERSTTGYTITT